MLLIISYSVFDLIKNFPSFSTFKFSLIKILLEHDELELVSIIPFSLTSTNTPDRIGLRL